MLEAPALPTGQTSHVFPSVHMTHSASRHVLQRYIIRLSHRPGELPHPVTLVLSLFMEEDTLAKKTEPLPPSHICPKRHLTVSPHSVCVCVCVCRQCVSAIVCLALIDRLDFRSLLLCPDSDCNPVTGFVPPHPPLFRSHVCVYIFPQTMPPGIPGPVFRGGYRADRRPFFPSPLPSGVALNITLFNLIQFPTTNPCD